VCSSWHSNTCHGNDDVICDNVTDHSPLDVFFIYLYQCWVYLTMLGTSGDDHQPPPATRVAPEESGDTIEPAASFSSGESDISLVAMKQPNYNNKIIYFCAAIKKIIKHRY